MELFAKVKAHDLYWWTRLDKAFRFLVEVGECRRQENHVVEVLSSEHDDTSEATLCSVLRTNGAREVESCFSTTFLHEVQGWLIQHCTASGRPKLYSFLELVFITAFLAPIRFPVSAGNGGFRYEFAQSLFFLVLPYHSCSPTCGARSRSFAIGTMWGFICWMAGGWLVWGLFSRVSVSGFGCQTFSVFVATRLFVLGRSLDLSGAWLI